MARPAATGGKNKRLQGEIDMDWGDLEPKPSWPGLGCISD